MSETPIWPYAKNADIVRSYNSRELQYSETGGTRGLTMSSIGARVLHMPYVPPRYYGPHSSTFPDEVGFMNAIRQRAMKQTASKAVDRPKDDRSFAGNANYQNISDRPERQPWAVEMKMSPQDTKNQLRPRPLMDQRKEA